MSQEVGIFGEEPHDADTTLAEKEKALCEIPPPNSTAEATDLFLY